MTVIRPGTKRAEELICDMNYRHPKGITLHEVYSTVSRAKRDSWQQICLDCKYLCGEKLHIVGAGSYNYSCIYAYPIYDHRVGEVIEMCIRKETASNTYELTLPIDEYRKRVG